MKAKLNYMKKLLVYQLIVMLFSSCNFFRGGEPDLKLIPYRSGDKWGYLDREGKIAINPQFNEAGVFMDGIALVRGSNDKWGYITDDGKYMINAAYKYASYFSEGLACVVPENGKLQFIDSKGNVKFTVSEGDYCGIFREGLAAVKVGEKWGYMDKDGGMRINPQFDYCRPFNEGLASVAVTNKEKGETLWGFVNTSGEIVVNYQFKGCDKDGFSEGVCMVSDGKKYGYVDKEGKYVINPQFDWAGSFRDGYAVIAQGSMSGYADKDGKIVINPQFQGAQHFSNGCAPVRSSDGKYGYIDSEGKYLINPQFEEASPFYGDIAFVASGSKAGIIDKEGKYVMNPQFEDINIDFESYKETILQSDYFDINSVVDKVCEGVEEQKFRSFSIYSTAGELKTAYPDLTVNEYDWTARTSTRIELNENAYIDGVFFGFSESPIQERRPVYKTVSSPTYWNANATSQVFDHYDIIANDNAKINSLSFNLHFSTDKARGKSEMIYKAIIDALSTKAALSAQSSGTLQNNYMDIKLNNYGSYITCAVTFKQAGS